MDVEIGVSLAGNASPIDHCLLFCVKNPARLGSTGPLDIPASGHSFEHMGRSSLRWLACHRISIRCHAGRKSERKRVAVLDSTRPSCRHEASTTQRATRVGRLVGGSVNSPLRVVGVADVVGGKSPKLFDPSNSLALFEIHHVRLTRPARVNIQKDTSSDKLSQSFL